MNGTIFTRTDLSGSDFRESQFDRLGLYEAIMNGVNLEGLDLSSTQLHNRKLRGANLRNVKGVWTIYGADFYEADLRGANFSQALEDPPRHFAKRSTIRAHVGIRALIPRRVDWFM